MGILKMKALRMSFRLPTCDDLAQRSYVPSLSTVSLELHGAPFMSKEISPTQLGKMNEKFLPKRLGSKLTP